MSTKQIDHSILYTTQMSNIFEEAEGWQQLYRHFGSSSTIYICKRYKLSTTIIEDKTYAFKTITLPPIISNQQSVTRTQLYLKFKERRQIKSEIIALLKLQNYSSIIRLYQVILEKDKGNEETYVTDFFHNFLKRKSKTDRNISMVLEYCNQGTLEQYLKKQKYISEQEIIKIGLQILKGLSSMKEQHILHRDLRPINILISEEGLKLCDFDIAFIEGYSQINDLFMSMVERVVAPQIKALMQLSQQNKINLTSESIYKALQESDLYSLGVILFQMALGKSFEVETFRLKLQLDEWKHSLELRSIITGLLLQDTKNRLKIQEVTTKLKNISQLQSNQLNNSMPRDLQEYIFNVNLIDTQNSEIEDIKQQDSYTSNSISISDWSIEDQTLVTSRRPQGINAAYFSNQSMKIIINTTVNDL